MFPLYIVIHRASGKCYIGYTGSSGKTAKERWEDHKGDVLKGSMTYFHRALRKHGIEEFDWNVFEMYSTRAEVKQAEIFWIAYLRSQNVELYNATDGGDGAPGYLWTEAARNATSEGTKIGLARMTPEEKAAHSANQSAAQTGKKRGPQSPESNAARSTTFLNMSPERKAEWSRRLSVAAKGKKKGKLGPQSPEHIAKRVAAVAAGRVRRKAAGS